MPLSPTSMIHEGAERSVAETCFPMKVALGHVLNLLTKNIDFLFLPSIINLHNWWGSVMADKPINSSALS